jgi:hypothetical protein
MIAPWYFTAFYCCKSTYKGGVQQGPKGFQEETGAMIAPLAFSAVEC